MKRGLLGLSLLVFLTQVISAQFFSGYGRFSIGDFFSSVDPQTIILTLLFLIFFALIFYTLSRFFKGPYGQPNKGIAGVIAFAVSSLIIYGLYRTGFDISGLFYDLGFSSGLLYPIFTIFFLIAAGLLIKKVKFSGFLMVFGLFLILLTIFTEIFYEKGIVLIIGLVLLLVGFLLRRRRRRRYGGGGPGGSRGRRGRGAGGAGDSGGGGRGGRGRGGRGRTVIRNITRTRGDTIINRSRTRGDVDRSRTRGDVDRSRTRGDVDRSRTRGDTTVDKSRRRWGGTKNVDRSRTGGIRREEGKLRRAQKAAYKEEARRQRGQQAQEQIQQINNEIARLQQMIPSASVIERGKIEDQIRAFEKRARKLR